MLEHKRWWFPDTFTMIPMIPNPKVQHAEDTARLGQVQCGAP